MKTGQEAFDEEFLICRINGERFRSRAPSDVCQEQEKEAPEKKEETRMAEEKTEERDTPVKLEATLFGGYTKKSVIAYIRELEQMAGEKKDDTAFIEAKARLEQRIEELEELLYRQEQTERPEAVFIAKSEADLRREKEFCQYLAREKQCYLQIEEQVMERELESLEEDIQQLREEKELTDPQRMELKFLENKSRRYENRIAGVAKLRAYMENIAQEYEIKEQERMKLEETCLEIRALQKKSWQEYVEQENLLRAAFQKLDSEAMRSEGGDWRYEMYHVKIPALIAQRSKARARYAQYLEQGKELISELSRMEQQWIESLMDGKKNREQ